MENYEEKLIETFSAIIYLIKQIYNKWTGKFNINILLL